MRSGVVATQVALTAVLLVVATLVAASQRNVLALDTGFDPTGDAPDHSQREQSCCALSASRPHPHSGDDRIECQGDQQNEQQRKQNGRQQFERLNEDQEGRRQ
jgi:hypothetical protein